MDPLYQEKHLEFISNNNGSTISDIVVAGLPFHLSPLLLSLVALLPGISHQTWTFRFCELFVTIIPPLLTLTVLSENPEYVILPLALLCCVVFLVVQYYKISTKDDSSKKIMDLVLTETKSIDAITNFRSSMLLVTATCILAVDFPIFPRKFAKTENYGYGLMDLGVGGFMFAAGLTSPEAKNVPTSLRKVLPSCLPLLALGLGRLIAITSTGYHENVTEYGLHWNFFFTLAIVKILSSMVLPSFSGKSVWVGSVGVAVLYEGFLSFGAVDWILSDAPRDTFLSSNREGLCSSCGYLAIYMAGVAWGREILIFPFTFKSLVEVSLIFVFWSVIMWLSLMYSTTFFLPPSRRLANYTFFTWVVAYNLSILTCFLLIQLVVVATSECKLFGVSSGVKKREKKSLPEKRRKNSSSSGSKKPVLREAAGNSASVSKRVYSSPEIYQAISHNSLLYFLLANVATGCVNLLVPTIETDDLAGLWILLVYLTSLSLITILLYRYKLRLKFW